MSGKSAQRVKRRPDTWQPMRPADILRNRETGEAVPLRDDEKIYTNGTYHATLRAYRGADGVGVVHLSIRRADRKPVRDWRHMQAIKNDILGPEVEAVELYPAESRLVDTANEFHLWAPVDDQGAAVPFPFGFNDGRVVTGPEALADFPGAVQRPLMQREHDCADEGCMPATVLDEERGKALYRAAVRMRELHRRVTELEAENAALREQLPSWPTVTKDDEYRGPDGVLGNDYPDVPDHAGPVSP